MPQSESPLLDSALPAALVAFGGHCELAWLRLLKPGYRHCFLLRRVASGWLLYDPRSDMTELALWPACSAEDLSKILRNKGYRVVSGNLPAASRHPAPLAAFTCVEAVKRALGIRKRWILTPWQLYRYLTAQAGGAAAERN
ncbi:MAG: hypothetical protein WD489_09300 [Rhodovibrionaceae bacterium]